MNTITLKRNNVPTKPGIYFALFPGDETPSYWEIICKRTRLHLACGGAALMPLNQCRKGILWSDALTFTTEGE